MSTTPPVAPPALLVTKLRPPQLARDFVPRPRLLDRLLEGLDRPLTLVTAPAGFGKTTLIAGVVASFTGPCGWLTVDEHDNHLPTFVEHLVGAIQTTFPDACRSTLGLLRQPRTPSVDLLVRALANELAELPQGTLLVLDEYDVIQNPLVDTLLVGLLRHPTSGLHLVIAARAQPALPLARLRARGQVTEIDAHDLRFSRAEAQAFLDRSLGVALSDEAVAALEAQTEEWIAGLRLMTIAVSQQPDSASVMRMVAGPGPRAVREFLLEEILLRQSPAVQAFLLQTALFDRFCAPLCDAVVVGSATDGGSQLMLEQIERANLFVVALDAHGGWYRYHSLFRDALRQRLEAGTDAAKRAGLQAEASA